MSGVTFDPVPQANPQASRSRSGRDAVPATDDGFGLLIDSDANSGPGAGASSATADRKSQSTTTERDTSAPATTSLQDEKPADSDGTDTEAAHSNASDTAGAMAVYATLQASAATAIDTTTDSSDTLPVANPPAMLPGETAALALARMAQDVEAAPAPQLESDGTVPATPAILTAGEDGNAALATAADLATRVPAEATVVEAEAKLQAAAVITPEDATEHGRMISLTAAQTQPQLPRSDQPETPALTPADDQAIAKPDDTNTGTAHTRPEQPPHPARSANNDEPAPPPARAQAAAEPPAAAQSQSPDSQASIEVAPNALPATQVSAPVPQLTVAPAHPNVTVPVTALAVEIAANVQIGRSRFEIRLDPPELGRIEVKLDVDRQGQVTSHIIVEKPATLDLLRRDAPQLERALQDAGLKTSDNGLQFSLRDQQSQSGRQDDNGRGAQRLTVMEDENTPRPVAGNSYGRMLGSTGGIDMRV